MGFKVNLIALEKIHRSIKRFQFQQKNKTKRIDKDGNEDITTVSYKRNSIGSARFMASSLSNLINNLAEGIHKINYFLEYESAKDNLVKYKCLTANEKYSNKIDQKLKESFKNIFKFSNNDINKFICC